MKIDKITLEQMKEELMAVFKIVDKVENTNSILKFIDGSDWDRSRFWIKAHQWAMIDDSKVSPKAAELFKDFPKNYDHELYPCDTNDSSLATALRAIAKQFSSEGICWDPASNKVSKLA